MSSHEEETNPEPTVKKSTKGSKKPKTTEEKPRKTAGKKPTKKKPSTEGKEGKEGEDDKKRRKKPNNTSYASYIYKVLKQVHPDTGISKKSMVIMDSFVHDLFEQKRGIIEDYYKKHFPNEPLDDDILERKIILKHVNLPFSFHLISLKIILASMIHK